MQRSGVKGKGKKKGAQRALSPGPPTPASSMPSKLESRSQSAAAVSKASEWRTTRNDEAQQYDAAEHLTPQQQRQGRDVSVLVRDMLGRNERIRALLGMKPREDPITKDMRLLDKISSQDDLSALSQYAHDLKLENVALQSKLTAASETHDVSLKSVSSKVEIIHKSLFQGQDVIGGGTMPSPSSSPSPLPRSKENTRLPWSPPDEHLDPFQEEEFIEDVWIGVSGEFILDLSEEIIQEAAEGVDDELQSIASDQPPPRRNSSISLKGGRRRSSVKIPAVGFTNQRSSAAQKLEELKSLPQFMQPLSTLESKRSERLKKREDSRKKMELLLTELARVSVNNKDELLHPPPQSLTSAANKKSFPPRPFIKSAKSLHCKRRADEFGNLMLSAFDRDDGSVPRFMQVPTKDCPSATRSNQAHALLQGVLGRGGYHSPSASTSLTAQTEMEHELKDIKKALGLKSRASIYFVTS